MMGRVSYRLTAALAIGVAILALLVVDEERNALLAREADIEVYVPTDAGPGSLREAIFRAAASSSRARIVLRVPDVRIRTPLPPVTNPRGVVMRCAPAVLCSIDGTALQGGPVLDIGAPGSRIEELRIFGASDSAVRVRAARTVFQNVTLENNGTGIDVADDLRAVVVVRSRFVGNAYGLRIAGPIDRSVVRESVFENQSEAGLWAVSGTQSPGEAGDALVVVGNRFNNNKLGAVLIHVPTLVERNDITGSGDTGIYLGGAKHALIGNRIQGKTSYGVFADAVWSTTIRENEIGDNALIGLFMRSGGSNFVDANRIYRNGFGIVVVFTEVTKPSVFERNIVFSQAHDAVWLFAGTPVFRDNRVVDNHGAGIRLVLRELDRGSDDAKLTTTNHFEQNEAAVALELWRESQR